MEKLNTKNKLKFSRMFTKKINRSVALINSNSNCSHNAYDANIINNDCMENTANYDNENTTNYDNKNTTNCDNKNAILNESLYCSSHSYIDVNISCIDNNVHDNIDKLSNNIRYDDSNTGNDILLVSKLAKWATEENITLSALKNLFSVIRKILGCDNLPKDPRTLLKTPNIIVISLGCETYYYFSIEITLNLFCTNYKINIQENDFLLAVNIDGLPISKSTNSSFWPILCLMKQIFLIALYHVRFGKTKIC